jgi:hypothetical protein
MSTSSALSWLVAAVMGISLCAADNSRVQNDPVEQRSVQQRDQRREEMGQGSRWTLNQPGARGVVIDITLSLGLFMDSLVCQKQGRTASRGYALCRLRLDPEVAGEYTRYQSRREKRICIGSMVVLHSGDRSRRGGSTSKRFVARQPRANDTTEKLDFYTNSMGKRVGEVLAKAPTKDKRQGR